MIFLLPSFVDYFPLFLLLHSHHLNLSPPAAHCNAAALSAVPSLSSAAMHLGKSQDVESDPDDEVNQSLHHLIESLLLFLLA